MIDAKLASQGRNTHEYKILTDRETWKEKLAKTPYLSLAIETEENYGISYGHHVLHCWELRGELLGTVIKCGYDP